MKKLICGALAGAVIAQIWGMISWMALPWHMLDFKQFSNESAVVEVFKGELQGSGLYTLPNMDPSTYDSEEAMAEWDRKASSGPFAFISVRAEGVPTGMGVPMAIGFLLNFVIALALMWLVIQTSITCPIGRTVFIAVAGTVGALYPHISHWNWWHFPVAYTVVGIVDILITWVLAGFVMVKLSDRCDAKKTAK